MASDADLVFRGTKHDDTLRRMYEALPDFDDGDLVQMVAALVWLDQQAGKDSAGNVVVMAPGYAMWLPPMVTFPDPEIDSIVRQLLAAGEEDREPDESLAARAEQVFTHPFQVTFTYPNDDVEYKYPVIDGLTRTIRVMDEEEATSPDATGIYTAAASGERIYIQERPY